MKEISEDSKFEVSLKTLGGIGVLIATLVGMWFDEPFGLSYQTPSLLPQGLVV